MSVSTVGGKKKAEIIEDFKYHEKDTGSSEVQIALLTARINHLVEHLKKNKKDNHTNTRHSHKGSDFVPGLRG